MARSRSDAPSRRHAARRARRRWRRMLARAGAVDAARLRLLGGRAQRGRRASSARSASPISSATSTPSIEGIPEMGWMFAADAGGQGYATEACAAALAWVDGALDADRDRRDHRRGQRALDPRRREAWASRAARKRSIAASRSCSSAVHARSRVSPATDARCGRRAGEAREPVSSTRRQIRRSSRARRRAAGELSLWLGVVVWVALSPAGVSDCACAAVAKSKAENATRLDFTGPSPVIRWKQAAIRD